ncbi:hypothetical protein PVAP13_2KG267458 [Panicum virgatum]|uniref:Uncharacterized protein n=1 Tax=Panicum virgatum TaxID=38727 RepID=A0A8T0W106_PANVG|nr:hypothetical protein PVAP13_2KG267458 [Panicum virgatum]
MENQTAVPLARRLTPRRPPPLLLRHRTWRSRRRSTAPLAGDLLPAMASRGHRHGRRPGSGEEDAPNRAAMELEEGAATAVAGRRGHQIQLPPDLEAAGSGQPRRGRALEEGAGEVGVPGAATPPLRSSSSAHARRRCPPRKPWRGARRRRRSSCGRGELVLLRVGAVLIAGVCAVSCSSIPAARRTRSSFEFGSLQASAP